MVYGAKLDTEGILFEIDQAKIIEWLRDNNIIREEQVPDLHDEEHLANDKIVVLVDDVEAFSAEYPEGIAKWKFTKRDLSSASEIKMSSVEEFKGLESVMVIYIHSETVTPNMNYIAYTRAKYYLIELIRR